MNRALCSPCLSLSRYRDIVTFMLRDCISKSAAYLNRSSLCVTVSSSSFTILRYCGAFVMPFCHPGEDRTNRLGFFLPYVWQCFLLTVVLSSVLANIRDWLISFPSREIQRFRISECLALNTVFMRNFAWPLKTIEDSRRRLNHAKFLNHGRQMHASTHNKVIMR